jgi:thiol-disulfide isomerase/thioredoxin
MSKFVNAFLNYIRPFTKYAWVFLIVIIFVIIAFYAYKKYASPAISKSKYKDVANAEQRGLNADLYFFHADWCPHCKKAAPEWSKFESEYNGKSINGYTIITHDIDCTKDSMEDQDQNVADLIKKFDIKGYPTIKLTTDDGKTVDFESKITKNSLETFVNNVL